MRRICAMGVATLVLACGSDPAGEPAASDQKPPGAGATHVRQSTDSLPSAETATGDPTSKPRKEGTDTFERAEVNVDLAFRTGTCTDLAEDAAPYLVRYRSATSNMARERALADGALTFQYLSTCLLRSHQRREDPIRKPPPPSTPFDADKRAEG